MNSDLIIGILCVYGVIFSVTRLILWPLLFEDDFPWPLNKILDLISKYLAERQKA